ncbi:MAG: hypothetical protein PHN19_05910 [Patescibacteria group bacterium]|nr:hypothetical protein [Patescibacteria group bacterium]
MKTSLQNILSNMGKLGDRLKKLSFRILKLKTKHDDEQKIKEVKEKIKNL